MVGKRFNVIDSQPHHGVFCDVVQWNVDLIEKIFLKVFDISQDLVFYEIGNGAGCLIYLIMFSKSVWKFIKKYKRAYEMRGIEKSFKNSRFSKRHH